MSKMMKEKNDIYKKEKILHMSKERSRGRSASREPHHQKSPIYQPSDQEKES